MVKRKFGLTLRQAQALLSIAYRKYNFGSIKLSDLITDMGVSFATLADHLKALQVKRYIQTARDAKPRNLAFLDEITLTPRGEKVAQKILQSIDATYSKHTVGSIFDLLKTSFEPKGYQLNLLGTRTKTTSFAKAFEELITKNRTEPVLTSIAMYTDLDSQLNLMRDKDKTQYMLLSRAKLNLEIRNGRLASIAIPTAIRRSTRLTKLKQILGSSWSWMGTVNATSIRRYWQEAMSLGLLQVDGDSLITMKPTTTKIISWLASKTYFTFINTIPTAPKCSLVLFRESFRFPSEEDMLNPKNADVELPWLESIWDNMLDKMDYIDTIREGLTILKDSANLMQEYEGSLIPTIIIRKINKVPDLTVAFNTIMKRRDTITAKILMAISVKPALSIYELYSDLKRKAKQKVSIKEIEEIISILVSRKLVHIATSHSTMKEYARLFSFIHLPYFTSKIPDNKETNAVLRSMKPYLLQRMKELFAKQEEKVAIYDILSNLMETKIIDLEDIEREFGKTVSRKLLIFGYDLNPFVTIPKDYSKLSLNENNIGLNNILINSLLYSTFTDDDALAMYSQTIADLVEKDTPWGREVGEESKSLVSDLIDQNIKTGF